MNVKGDCTMEKAVEKRVVNMIEAIYRKSMDTKTLRTLNLKIYQELSLRSFVQLWINK